MVAPVFLKVHHLFVNVHQHFMVIVVKIVLRQQHRMIHVLNSLVKMVVNVFPSAIVNLSDL
jgi:hypothetical protein